MIERRTMREHIGTPRRALALSSSVESSTMVRPVAPSLGALARAMTLWGLALLVNVSATLASGTVPSPLPVHRPATNATSSKARPPASVIISGTTKPATLDR
jgi:hypothetical protein